MSEIVRISDCCGAETSQHGFDESRISVDEVNKLNGYDERLTYWCNSCGLKCTTHAGECNVPVVESESE